MGSTRAAAWLPATGFDQTHVARLARPVAFEIDPTYGRSNAEAVDRPADPDSRFVLPFENGAFESVLSLGVHGSISPLKQSGVFAEVRRVLRPGGCYVLDAPGLEPVTSALLDPASCPLHTGLVASEGVHPRRDAPLVPPRRRVARHPDVPRDLEHPGHGSRLVPLTDPKSDRRSSDIRVMDACTSERPRAAPLARLRMMPPEDYCTRARQTRSGTTRLRG